MLAVEPGDGARHLRVWDLQQELRPDDLVVVNDTRVLHARLAARRASGGKVELLVLEPAGDVGVWRCLARPARRLAEGERLRVDAVDAPPMEVEITGRDAESGGCLVRFPGAPGDAEAIEPLLRRYGSVPLPPYIHGQEPADAHRYQTRYARRPGSAAAPTAGLHLSDELLAALSDRGIRMATVTLHVGLGTFRPVETEDLRHLSLHRERVELSEELVEAVRDCRRRGGRVIAVGTTSVRSLEGVAALQGGDLRPFSGSVDLVIQPGFRFRVVEGLLTNFHLPRSSLLLLVSALIGRQRLLDLYGEAIRSGYRFFSYGDAMWIPPAAVLPGARG
jgi:S-adenosylmethionine:tRNA ribosyltransferase-isomerase